MVERVVAWNSWMLSRLTVRHNFPGSRSLEAAHSSQGQPNGQPHQQFQAQQFQRNEGAYY